MVWSKVRDAAWPSDSCCPGTDLGEWQTGFCLLLCLSLRFRWESQRNSRTVSDMKTKAFLLLPLFFISIFTGGRSVSDNTRWYSSLVV